MNTSGDTPIKNRPQALNTILQRFRLRLAHAEALPQLAILGILSGFATGLVAVAFRLSMEWPLTTLLPGHDSEGFEALAPELRFLLPLAGVVVIGIIFHFNDKQARQLGVGHVIERYQSHQAHLPLRNAILQFFGGIAAVTSGHSVGREGPAVHLGAASSSLLGQLFKLPNNSLRILVGCGVASAIAASFNTPLAGVILAMEVVLMEYTITGFIPIILASVCGAVTSRVCFGDAPAFDIPALTMGSMLELPFLALCGIVVGLASAAMLTLYSYTLRFKDLPLAARLLAAGLIAGGAGVLVPQVMGIGYDTLELAMLGQASFALLATIVAAKLLVSTITLALGIPGGSIGPTLVIGACLGACLGIIGNLLTPGESTAIGFYAIVCMGAMMAGVLNAPLAALLALLELTYNPGVLLPAMLVIVIACITARMVSRQPGLFLIGRDSTAMSSPITQALSRVGVTSVMTHDFVAHSRHIAIDDAEALLSTHPEWILIEASDTAARHDLGLIDSEDQEDNKYILRAADLSRYLDSLAAPEKLAQATDQVDAESNIDNLDPADPDVYHIAQQAAHQVIGQVTDQTNKPASIDLIDIPAERWRLYPIHSRATLYEAAELIRKKNGYAVSVSPAQTLSSSQVTGIITQERIDHYYQ